MLKDVDESITLLQGHLVFGVHEWIHREFTCITLLREPARAISIYRYVLTNRQQFSQQEALTIFSKNRLLSGIHDC
jgi:hypothetical protein